MGKYAAGETLKVSERVNFLIGCRVTVRVSYAELGGMGAETFETTFVDTIPLGREYFFVFETGNKKRLVRCSSVVEVREYEPPPPRPKLPPCPPPPINTTNFPIREPVGGERE